VSDRPETLGYSSPANERASVHDVHAEPHMRRYHDATPEPTVEPLPRRDKSGHLSSVYDEPLFSPDLGGPRGAGYADWLAARMAAMPAWRTWLICLGLILLAGPASVIGTLLTSGNVEGGFFGAATAVFVAPVVEELMKALAALWVAESRPHWFRSRWQIVLTLLAAGLGFAAIENLIYLNIYFPDPPPGLATWRWTVCVALHTGCSLIASVGVVKVWSAALRERRPPKVSLAGPWLTAAAVVHGLYNAGAVTWEISGVF
jgi:hypothetical protein